MVIVVIHVSRVQEVLQVVELVVGVLVRDVFVQKVAQFVVALFGVYDLAVAVVEEEGLVFGVEDQYGFQLL